MQRQYVHAYRFVTAKWIEQQVWACVCLFADLFIGVINVCRLYLCIFQNVDSFFIMGSLWLTNKNAKVFILRCYFLYIVVVNMFVLWFKSLNLIAIQAILLITSRSQLYLEPTSTEQWVKSLMLKDTTGALLGFEATNYEFHTTPHVSSLF